MRTILILLIAAAMLIPAGGCSAEEETAEQNADIYSDVWLGEAGQDYFAFDFYSNSEGDDPGVVHCLRDGRKYSEIPFTTLDVRGDNEIEIYLGSTGVTYNGQLSGSLISGEIVSPAGPPLSMDLRQVSPETLRGLCASTGGEYRYSPPEAGGDLPAGSCVDHSIQEESLEELITHVISGEAGVIHSILITSGGELILEEYFHGYTSEDLHHLASVTKSVSSLLIGIAVDNGFIDSVTVPLSEFFAEADPELNLEHLLTMSLGLDWSDEEAESVHGTGEDFFSGILSLDRIAAPGETFRYVNADVNLISGILKESTGMYPDEFAEEYLFQPLGINEYDWEYGETDGHRMMDGSLHLRPLDMIKIGLMVQNGGNREEISIVSGQWLEHSTEIHLPVDDLFQYGYLWWLTRAENSNFSTNAVLASGWGSQFIVIIPEHDMVIAVTGGNEDNGKNWKILQLAAEILFSDS